MQNKIIITAFAVSSTLLMSACSTTVKNYQPQSLGTNISTELNQLKTRNTGEALLEQGSQQIRSDAIKLDHSIKLKFGGYILSEGYYAKIGEDNSREYYAPFNGSQSGKVTSYSILIAPKYLDSIIIDKQTQKLSTISSKVKSYNWEEVPFTREKITIDGSNAPSQKLFYNGISKNVLNFSYTNSNGTAKAKTEKFSLNLSTSRTLSVHGAVIDVISADADKIQYKVRKGFNSN